MATIASDEISEEENAEADADAKEEKGERRGKVRDRVALLPAACGQSVSDQQSLSDGAEADHGALLTIDEVLDLAGCGKFQVRLHAITGLGYMADTAELLFVTFLLPEFATMWPELSRPQLSLVPALSAAGALLAAPLWGLASDLHGRRSVFLGSLCLVVVAGLAGAAVSSFIAFLVTRVLVGAGLGGALTSTFVVFMEFCPTAQRGKGTMLLTLWGVLGVFYVGLCARFVIPAFGWRAYCVSAALPSCVLLLLRAPLPESPRWLQSRGRSEEAMGVLRQVASINGTFLPVKLQLAPLPEAPRSVESFRQLARPPLLRTFLTLAVVWFGLSTAYAGFTFWLPSFLAAKSMSPLDTYETYLLMCVAEVPGLFLATAAIDRLGRRHVLAVSLLGCAGALCAFSRASSQLNLKLCTSASYFFVVGAWATVYTLTPESFPTAVRATAAGGTRLFAGLGTMLAAPLGSLLLGVSENAPLFAYAGTLTLCALCALSLPAETGETRLKPLREGGARPVQAGAAAQVA